MQPKEGDDDTQETRAQIHERIGRGIWGGALPGSWEIVDAEMYAIYSFLRTKADETETTLQPHRCLVMSDSETALKEIERAYRGRTRGETNRSALNAAVQAQIDIIQRNRGYVIFIFTEGHAGNAPNSMADAAAKAHLRSRVTSAYEMDLARHVTNRACIYTHEEEGQAPEIRDRRLYQEAKEKIGRWVRKWLDGGHAARKEGDDNVWRTVIKATGTISGDTRYEGDKERGPNSTQRQPEACGEKARLRLVHGMRTGQTRGIEHGRRWRASLEAEARQDGWDEEGGGACADGAEGCWHPGCCRTIANTRHVLCAECEACLLYTSPSPRD